MVYDVKWHRASDPRQKRIIWITTAVEKNGVTAVRQAVFPTLSV